MTEKWDVSLMVSRGVSSTTFIWDAAEDARLTYLHWDARTHVYLLFDADAGGNRASRTIATELPEFAGEDAVEVTRLDVTDEQIIEWELPTRPARKTDTEAHKNPDYAVELDAIPPEKLTDSVEYAITDHIDFDAWEAERETEEVERRRLQEFAEGWS